MARYTATTGFDNFSGALKKEKKESGTVDRNAYQACERSDNRRGGRSWTEGDLCAGQA